LWGAEEREAEADEEEDHRWLVEEADAGGDAEDGPPHGCAVDALLLIAKEQDEGEEAGHPEHAFEAVHAEVAVEAEIQRDGDDGHHAEGLCGAAAAEGPAEDAGEEDAGCSCGDREGADAEEAVAEEGFGDAGLQGDDGAVVDVAPSEMAAAHEVVELVAEVADADVALPEGGGDVEQELDGCEGEGEPEGLLKGWVCGAYLDGWRERHGGRIRMKLEIRSLFVRRRHRRYFLCILRNTHCLVRHGRKRRSSRMEWTPGGTSGDIEDRRGDSGGGGGFNLGGGGLGIGGFILVVVIGLISGRGFIGSLLTGLGAAAGSGGGAPMQQRAPQRAGGPVQESAAEHRDVQLVSFVLDDAQKTWTALLPEQTGRNYRHAKLVLFRNATQSGCGDARSATGPFYCPEDERVYIDLGFWDELKRLGGVNSDFAQAYVITHELGHHVQNILGTEAKVQQAMRNPATRSKASVELELQADCYAGIWAHSTQQRKIIDGKDVDEALQNAAAVGDDHIQKMQRGTVSPESFTHGSSAERQGWFKRGLTTGQVNQCDTFTAGPDGYGG